MSKAYLSIGSNIGDRLQNLKDCVKFLSDEGLIIIKISSIYETEPIGYTDQDKFYNVVLLIETEFSPYELLKKTQHIEDLMGRKRIIIWGPRIIDIDIVLYENISINEKDLQIPHPRMLDRAFVLIPLAELEPLILINNRSIESYLEKISEKNMEKLTYNLL